MNNNTPSTLLFTTVKRAIDALDPMGLLAMGAPSDEYNGLAGGITTLIRADMSSAQIARIMAEEFSEDFGEHFSSNRFLSAAEEVKAALDQGATQWRWGLVGNIVQTHEYGEEHKILVGSKQFGPGAKVYIAPAQWGDGFENVCVIGKPRHRRGLIELVMPLRLIENLRLKRVFQPAALERMEKSQYRWWSDSEEDRMTILKLAASIHDCGLTFDQFFEMSPEEKAAYEQEHPFSYRTIREYSECVVEWLCSSSWHYNTEQAWKIVRARKDWIAECFEARAPVDLVGAEAGYCCG